MNAKMRDWKGKWAMITGASSGMGMEYARQLAAAGVSLVIVARRTEILEKIAKEIKDRYAVGVEVETCDLAQDGAASGLMGQLTARGRQIDILINNAGYGVYGDFLGIDWKKEKTMLALDIVALVELTRFAAVSMKERGWGRILQVASIGGYQPSPFYASYAAAKAFVLNYGVAIAEELRGSGVSVTVLSPGVTKTGFFDVAGQQPKGYFASSMMTADKAARIGLEALANKKSSVVPGFSNKVLVFLNRLLSRPATARIARTFVG